MSTFKVQVLKLTIEPHPDADAIELAKIGEYRSIVRKGQFKTGDLGVFIPPAAILPDWIISKLGLEGKLAGKQKNRVKEVRLRGVLSEGLIFPVNGDADDADIERPVNIEGHPDATEVLLVKVGDDVAEFLGITKYEPVVPAHMAGEVCNLSGYTLKYDIENYKRYPDVLVDDAKVTITEKLHGTNVQIGYVPSLNHPEIIDGNIIIASKGLGGQGLVFKDNEKNASNLYVKTYKQTLDSNGLTIGQRIKALAESGKHSFITPDTAVYIVGEIFGPGVQTGFEYGFKQPTFLAFDVYIGLPGRGRYLHEFEKMMVLHDLQIGRVPVLYFGPWSKALIERYTSGQETLSGTKAHMREGIVITPQLEYRHDELGRVILKSVSAEYLTRKGNTTEYS
jgi:RNA ligase (TIGR02306 family)